MTLQHNILAYFQQGGRLTVQKAFHVFHTTELRKIVSQLRRLGHDIRSNPKGDETPDGRKITYNEYYLNIEL